MMNSLEKIDLIDTADLDGANYFQSFLEAACSKKILSKNETESIQMQCLQILSGFVDLYTNGESSSVRVETAQSMMQSIFYCIGVYLKDRGSCDNCINDLKELPMAQIYELGNALVKKQVKKSRYLLDIIKKNLIETDNIAYNDTTRKGLDLFFKSYDADFAAHEAQGSIDYPLCVDDVCLTGVEYLYSYLQKLYLENKFCGCFAPDAVATVLRGYDEHYAEDLINIFERIFANALGCVLLKKEVSRLALEPSDIEKLKSVLSHGAVNDHLKYGVPLLIDELDITDSSLQNYMLSAADHLAAKIENAIVIDRLDSIFVCPKQAGHHVGAVYRDGIKMTDENLRLLIEAIRNADRIEEKISLIKKEVHSIVDLIDVLEGGCLFHEEFAEFYASMDDMEAALLVQYIPKGDTSGSDLTFNEAQWQDALKTFFAEAGEVRKNHINKLLKMLEKTD